MATRWQLLYQFLKIFGNLWKHPTGITVENALQVPETEKARHHTMAVLSKFRPEIMTVNCD